MRLIAAMAGPEQGKGGGGGGSSEAMKGAAQGMHTSEVLHQRSKPPICPMRMAVGGFAMVLTIGYLTLYSKKKPEASALDVAKVATGVSHQDNTHPGK